MDLIKSLTKYKVQLWKNVIWKDCRKVVGLKISLSLSLQLLTGHNLKPKNCLQTSIQTWRKKIKIRWCLNSISKIKSSLTQMPKKVKNTMIKIHRRQLILIRLFPNQWLLVNQLKIKTKGKTSKPELTISQFSRNWRSNFSWTQTQT